MARGQNHAATELVHVGFGNFLAVNKVLAIVTPSSAPIQRMIREGKEEGIVIDMTNGRRTQAVIFLDTGTIGLVGLSLAQLSSRGLPVPAELLVRRKRSRRA